MEELQQQIIEWAKAKGIDNPQNQRLKMIEEIGEVAGAILKGNRDEILMEIGDFAVTVIILHRLLKIDTLLPEPNEGASTESPTESIGWIIRLMDMNVVLYQASNLAAHFDSTLEECLTMAWNKIKDRQGKTVNGTFIKNE